MEYLEKILALIPSVDAGYVASITVALEFILRLIKSEKPLSILYIIAAVIKKLAEILLKISLLLDKVLPQRVKAPEVQAEVKSFPQADVKE